MPEGIQTAVDTKDLERLKKELAHLGDLGRKALSRAINDAVRKSRTLASKGIRDVYAIKAQDIKPYLKTKLSTPDRLTGELDASAPMQPLYDFLSGSQKGGIQVEVIRGAEKVVNGERVLTKSGKALREKNRKIIANTGAFVLSLPTGHTGIYEHVEGRTSNGHQKIKELFTIGAGIMMGGVRAGPEIAGEAADYLRSRLPHHVDFLLKQAAQAAAKK